MRLGTGSSPMGLAIMTILVMACPLGTAIASGSIHEIEGVPSDLASKLQNPPIRRQELFSHALRIIHSVESSPSCNRLAALTLINSCQSLEVSTKGDAGVKTDLGLDEVKSEYAARLAVCELLGARANVPPACVVFVPSSKACVKFRFKDLFTRDEYHSEDTLCYPDASNSQFGQCLRSLESRPQWWTSYSNARQNAVVMCQASRDAIEKDEKISLYKSLADATSDITSALAESIREAQARLVEQLAFVEEIKVSQAQALSELKKGRESSVSTLHSVTQDMRSAAQSVMDLVMQAFMRAENQVEELNQSIHKSKIGVQEARDSLLDLVKDVAIANSEHTALQNQQWQLSHEGALAVLQALRMVRTNELQALSEAFGGLRNELAMSSELMTNMYERQSNLDERLSSLDLTFDVLETVTSNLRSAVDETTEKIQQMTIFSGLGIAPGKLGGILLVIVGIWFASTRLAGYVAIISGITWLLHGAGASTWINSALQQASKVPRCIAILLATPTPPFVRFALLASVVVSSLMALVYFIGRSYIHAYEEDHGEQGLLLKIEDPGLPTAGSRRSRHFNIFSALRT